MDAESSRPQADCPEVNVVRSTGRPRKTGLLRGGPLNTFTGCEATLTTSLQVNGTFTEPASVQSERKPPHSHTEKFTTLASVQPPPEQSPTKFLLQSCT
ncbi:hypothetical protein A9B99_06980 [Mangrovibacter phragmitis]|uniref:Uncharacterized protein n=1 Tax=Mangrovibacter phragmitis TaxID=1691903 RepID=A0A1B7L4G2_9ENTR|nr:hypothetical protein A9B99_06980 [Mangrovibacter phragmitis]